MTINFDGANGLFPRMRVILDALEAQEVWQGTTLKSDLDAILSEWSGELGDADTYAEVQSVVRRGQSEQGSTGLKQALVALLKDEIIRQVRADKPSVAKSITSAIDELIVQMLAGAPETVEENVVGVALVQGGATKAQLVMDNRGVDGETVQSALAEVIDGTVDLSGMKLRGASKASTNSHEWPAGSGLSQTLVLNGISAGFFSNGNFDTESTVQAGHPKDWNIEIGNVGTTIDFTDFQTYTITIAGTPTSGYYTITLIDLDSNKYTCEPLSYDASGGTVQTALRKLPGFSAITVATTGTNPNYVHTLTYEEIAGTPAAPTARDEFNTGTVTPATGPAADTGGLTSKSLILLGDGAELTTFRQLVALSALTTYTFLVRLKKTATATGILRVALVDGANAVVNDEAGNANSLAIDVSTLSSSAFDAKVLMVRTPVNLPDSLKWEFKLTTAINATQKLYIDNSRLVTAQSLTNGLYAAGFTGPVAALSTDTWKSTITNDYAGRLQTAFWRHFKRLLPSATSPGETISDT